VTRIEKTYRYPDSGRKRRRMKFQEKTVILKDGTTALLRSPEAADAEQMRDYLRQTAAETHFMIRYPEEVADDTADEDTFLENILKSPREVMIGVFIGDDLAGDCALSCVNDRIKTRHRGSVGIALKEKYWGLGIGRILMEEIIAQAAAFGYEQIELGVFADNERALHLYESLGFERWGVTKNAFRLIDGECIDEILMGLPVRKNSHFKDAPDSGQNVPAKERGNASPGRPEGSEGIAMLHRMNREHAVLRAFGLPLIDWKPDMRILDVGCGGGMTIAEMLRLSENSRIDGIDYSKTSVEQAKLLNADSIGKRVCIRHGDVASMPYEDNTFDLVTAVETVYFWPDPDRALQEIRRVLKPGGIFQIMDEGSDPSILEEWPKIDGFMKVYTPDELRGLLSDNGFEDIHVVRGEEQLVAANGRKTRL
jgi:RimJ/RimL family protein N-acetyltransferase